MNKPTVFLLMFSSTPPDADPCCRYCLCKAILKLWYYYTMHIITTAFLFPNKMMPISLYLLSEHASFFLISKVLIVSLWRFPNSTRRPTERLVLFVVARHLRKLKAILSWRQRCKNNTTLNTRVGKVFYSHYKLCYNVLLQMERVTETVNKETLLLFYNIIILFV